MLTAAFIVWNAVLTAALAYALRVIRGKVMYTPEESNMLTDSLGQMVKTVNGSNATVRALLANQLDQKRELIGLREELKSFEESVVFREETMC